MERRKLVLGEEYGWKNYGSGGLMKGRLTSLKPLTVEFEQVSLSDPSGRTTVQKPVQSRFILCRWRDKEEWLEQERARRASSRARSTDRRRSRQEEIIELSKQLLQAGYKERLPGGFRAPHGQNNNFSISPEMLKRLLAAHPEFAPLEQGESALAELLGGEDASGASVLPPGSE